MVARHRSQIAARENTLGRHYSRFSRYPQSVPKKNQSLARSGNVKIAKRCVESANFG